MIQLKANLVFAAIDAILSTFIGAIALELYLALQGSPYSLGRVITLYEIKSAILIVFGFGVFSGLYAFYAFIDVFVGPLRIIYKRMFYKFIAFSAGLIFFSFAFSDNNDVNGMVALGIIGLISITASDFVSSWATAIFLKQNTRI